MNLEAQLSKMHEALESIKLLDAKAEHILKLSRAYASDAVHFMEKGQREDAIEAFGIAWAYLDALLHLGMAEVPDKFLDWFTIE